MLTSTARIARRAVIIGTLLGLSILFDGTAVLSSAAERSYSEFLKAVDAGEVTEVTIDGEEVTWKDARNQYETIRLDDPDLVRTLKDHGVRINVMPEHNENTILYALVNWFPMLLLIAALVFFVRRYRAAPAGRQPDDLQDLSAKLDDTNAHLARIEALLAGSPPKSRNPDLGS